MQFSTVDTASVEAAIHSYNSDNFGSVKPLSVIIKDGPLEKLWGWGGGGIRAAGIFFSLSNSLYEFF